MTSIGPDVIYDVGANNGDDTAYYLLKGYRVVAIEADPELANDMRKRFAREIENQRATILNCAVGGDEDEVTFYINERNSVLSSMVLPESSPDRWKSHRLPCRRLSSIIAEHGRPHFIKVDVEGVDAAVMADLSAAGVRPEFLSVEVHSALPLCHLMIMGYTRFRLVNCGRIGKTDAPTKILTRDGTSVSHVFPEHSSGPFGEDLTSDWLSLDAIMVLYATRRMVYGAGWFDVHATGAAPPT